MDNSSLYGKCIKLNKDELAHPEKINEISLTDAKKLAVFSENIAKQLEIYSDESSDNLAKTKALESISANYNKMVRFVKNNMDCFEPRNVFIKTECALIKNGIDVKNFSAQINEMK